MKNIKLILKIKQKKKYNKKLRSKHNIEKIAKTK